MESEIWNAGLWIAEYSERNPEIKFSWQRTRINYLESGIHEWQISLGYSTRMDQWPLQCWRPKMKRWKERHICVYFLLKHQWKQETFVFITFFSFRKVNFYSKICWFPLFIWFGSLVHWPRLINKFNRKMSMPLLYYPEIWRKIAKNSKIDNLNFNARQNDG